MAQTTAAPRDLEADLLIKAASKLQTVHDDWSNTASDMLDGALLYNRRLWTVFATSATREDNPLPHQIKQNIANLALFVFNRTLSIQSDPQPAKLPTLIAINREIAAGLRGE
jgi:flagellar biosynthesis activator protein FlaF